MRATILDVLDNYFGSQQYPPADGLNNGKIRQLRERILSFYQTYQLPVNKGVDTRLFLGSFLSSPPFTIDSAPYLSSALLCADSVVVFDPLHHFFCDEQYQRPRLMSAPPGWMSLTKKDPTGKSARQVLRPNYPLSKRYLSQALSWLSTVRPLIEAGLVLCIPAEKLVYANQTPIETLAKGARAIVEPLSRYTEKFSPDDITVDDNRKGMFAFAGGDRDKQISKYMGQGLEHFAKDIIIANSTQSLYTAPFAWEQHLGRQVLDGFASAETETRLIEGIRNLRLPILANLSPKILLNIHGDSGYAKFRSGIVEVLQHIDAEVGSEAFQDRVHQIERDILVPKVEALQREVSSDFFRRMTNAVSEGIFIFGQTYLANTATALESNANLVASALSAGMSLIRELTKSTATSPDRRIWATLLPEKPRLDLYGPTLTLRQQPGSDWTMDPVPTNRVLISKGVVKFPV